MIVDHILKTITEEESEREFSSPLRMSSSGKCQRAIAYQLHKFEAEPLSARARMVFRLGDTVEAEIKALLRKYPSDKFKISIPEQQKELSYKIEGVEIKGHIDGMVIEPEPMVFEVKSINTLGFARIGREGVPNNYRDQACSYMRALNVTKTLFLFYNKDTSHITEIIYEFEPDRWAKIKDRFSNVIKSTKENLPEREFGPNEDGKLPWECGYCAYSKYCWVAETVFNKKGKPTLKVKTNEKENSNELEISERKI